MISDRVIVATCAAVMTFAVTSNIYSGKIAKLKLDYETTAREKEKEFADELQRSAGRLAEAIAQRDTMLANVSRNNSALLVQLDRMRKLANDTGSGRMPKADTATGKSDGASVERCRALLVEGSELLREGAELSCRNAANHDALVKTIGD